MRVLVTWGSKLGGTEGIARAVGAGLRDAGNEVVLQPAQDVRSVAGFDAVVVGGALYANRWHPAARRLVDRHPAALRHLPVWLFSSGPLDDSATRATIPPTTQVAICMERLGAIGHATFGGRLAEDAKGFPASVMARTHSGDWRDPERIRAWAAEIAARLPSARPGVPIAHRGRSLPVLGVHAVAGWVGCAAVMAGALAVTSTRAAIILHAIAAPAIFIAIARHYFLIRGARTPLVVAIAFTAIVAGLDLAIVAGLAEHSLAMFGSLAGTWLPLALIFIATWLTGEIASTLPWPKPAPPAPTARISAPT